MNGRGVSPRSAGRWAAFFLGTTCLGIALVLWFAVRVDWTTAGFGNPSWPALLVTIVSYGVAGALLVDRRPDLPFGWLLSGAACSQVVYAATALPALAAARDGIDSTLVGWGLAASTLGFLPLAVQGIVYVRFPTGRPISRRGRALEVVIIAGTALALIGGLLRPDFSDMAPESTRGLSHPLTGGTVVGTIAEVLMIAAPLVVLAGLFAGLGVVARFRQAEGLMRQQLKWLTVGVIVSVALFPFAVSEVAWMADIDMFDSLLFVVTLAIPVLRYRLWSIDTILRRSLAYGAATAVLVGVYLAITAVGASVVSRRAGTSVAAIVIAFAFAPLASRVQRAVDRFAYGDRSDPYRTLSELDRRLAEVAEPGELLPAMVATLASSLRLPYVAIESAHSGIPLAAHGNVASYTERWPLIHEGTVEGFLIAAPRRGEETFDRRDRRLLEDVARHAGVAVHAEALTADLTESRQRLVSAREEERRRIRRDLHDGLGPVLTAVGLNIDAARSRLATDAVATDQHLSDAREATRQALDDIRRLVNGLRPPALDNLGLVGALELHLGRLTQAHCQVAIEAANLPCLPAAVEVAAYRIAVEAVTNTIRHTNASTCTVKLSSISETLLVDINDNGLATGPWTPSVGILSMREQARDLGGDLTCGPDVNGGRVAARLPVLTNKRDAEATTTVPR